MRDRLVGGQLSVVRYSDCRNLGGRHKLLRTTDNGLMTW